VKHSFTGSTCLASNLPSSIDVPFFTRRSSDFAVVTQWKCAGLLNTDPHACHVHGRCIGSDIRDCDAHHRGNVCEIPVCYGKCDKDACSDGGECEEGSFTCNCSGVHHGIECGESIAEQVLFTSPGLLGIELTYIMNLSELTKYGKGEMANTKKIFCGKILELPVEQHGLLDCQLTPSEFCRGFSKRFCLI